MSVRAVWKGHLKFGPVSCAVKLVGAVTEAERIHFRILNRKDRLPVKSAYLDEETGDPVESDSQVKGFELEDGDFLVVEPEELAQLKLTSEHTLELDATVALDAIDQRYREKPYYLLPSDKTSGEGFAAIRDALVEKKAAARSCIVLYQRGREVIIEPMGKGLLMTTLRDADAVLSEKDAFDGLADVKADAEMVEIADLLIEKKTGSFDPSKFEDRYENALIEMLEAKKAGRKPPKPAARPRKTNIVKLADVLRKSLEKEGIAPKQAAKRGGARKSA